MARNLAARDITSSSQSPAPRAPLALSHAVSCHMRERIPIVIEGLAGHVPTALVALNFHDAPSICDRLNRRQGLALKAGTAMAPASMHAEDRDPEGGSWYWTACIETLTACQSPMPTAATLCDEPDHGNHKLDVSLSSQFTASYRGPRPPCSVNPITIQSERQHILLQIESLHTIKANPSHLPVLIKNYHPFLERSDDLHLH